MKRTRILFHRDKSIQLVRLKIDVLKRAPEGASFVLHPKERIRYFSYSRINQFLRPALAKAKGYAEFFSNDFGSKIKLKKLVIAAILVFVVACSIRLIYLDDKNNRPEGWDPIIPTGGVFVSEAERIVESGFMQGDLSPRAHARHILHPPGYLLYLIGLFKIFEWDDRPAVMAVQSVLDSITAVLILILASWLTNLRIGTIAGLLIGVSPHLAYSSLFVSPESLFAMPVVLAVACLYLATEKNRMRYYLLTGIFVGLACWLRANGLAMAPFFAILALVLSKDRKLVLKGGLIMILATASVIAPITIRNYVITGRFIPLSVGFGVIFMQAVADYDFEKKYGLPKLDHEVAIKEAEWYNRPDYAKHFLRPDGIERDNARIGRTLDVIKRHPLFYASTIIRRMDFMLRYDLPPGPDDWPFHTATPVYVSRYALYGSGPPEQVSDSEIWSSGPRVISTSTADNSNAGLSPVKIHKKTDYVLRLEAQVESVSGVCRVTDEDGEIELGSVEIGKIRENNQPIYLSFASFNATTANIEFKSRESNPYVLAVNLKDARLIEVGPTPWRWTDPIRALVRGLQQDLYTTPVMRLLLLAGIAVLLLARRWRAFLLIAAVPIYYLMFQSLLHTEYRYILPMHYFLFILAAIALYFAWSVMREAFTLIAKRRRSF